jgi:hypothetical protein
MNGVASSTSRMTRSEPRGFWRTFPAYACPGKLFAVSRILLERHVAVSRKLSYEKLVVRYRYAHRSVSVSVLLFNRILPRARSLLMIL